MTGPVLTPLRRDVAFTFGLLSLALAIEIVEHGCGNVYRGDPQGTTAIRIRDREQAWIRSWILHGDIGHTACPPPVETVFEPDERVDAWGSPLVFACRREPQQPVEVRSAGEDGLFGTADDLTTGRWVR